MQSKEKRAVLFFDRMIREGFFEKVTTQHNVKLNKGHGHETCIPKEDSKCKGLTVSMCLC